MYQSCNRRLIPSMASSTLLSPSATSKPCFLHCDSTSRYSPHRRSAMGLQSKFSASRSSLEKRFKVGVSLSSCSRSQATRCGFCCRDCARRASFCFRVCATSASVVSSHFSSGVGYLRTIPGYTGSSASGSRSSRTRTRALATSVAPSPKKKTKEKSAEIPAIDQPSLTWGVMPPSAEGKKKVIEFLEKEGIDTTELHDVELPNTIEVMQERLDFLMKLGLSLEAINSYPLMVTCSIKKNLIPVLDYLERLGLRSRELPQFLEKYPMVLHSSVVIDLMPIVDYLLGLDIQRKDIIKVLARYPDVLGFRLEGTMSTSVAYLVSLGVRTRCIGRMLTDYPEILGMRVAKSIKPKVDFLISYGIPKAVVAKLLEGRPYMLGFDLSETIEPVVNDLLEAGVRREGIAAIITQYPDILGQGIRENLDRKTEWLVEDVRIDPKDVPVIIEKLPQILFIKEKLAMDRVRFFKNAGCSADDIAKMVTGCPQILALSIAQVMEPSLNFLLHDMKRSVKDVVSFPAYFTYDLKTRIMPRYNMIAEKGVDCSLEWFLNCTDQRFKDRLSAEYMDEDEPGPVFRMGGIVHTELKPVEEENLSEEVLDLETNRCEEREKPRSSPSRRRETTKMHQQQQRDDEFETASDMSSEDEEDADDDTDDGRDILRARLWDDKQQRDIKLDTASDMYSEGSDDTDDAVDVLRARLQEDDEDLESSSEFDISEEEEESNDDDDEWGVLETEDDDDDSDEVSEEEVQTRATNKSNR
ncbi:hypothetical protein GOP47_0003390 [Adiantum capillus-veneris]|uniref:Uncharacterized protein n=1 Tax=Adiantum capillus-veneris TaxID=13818 RepID=A0A9D4ZS85_ADICA|nr:hypothetical protein GOP47_0003390 [Adiantum capillus-veneris]